jgi:signal transduction histidine kinase
MLAILGCITVDHDLRLVALAGLVCLFASFTAIGLLPRAQLVRGRAQTLWILGAGTVTGCGVWATHFVAMLAYQSSLAITYDIALTTLSIVAAIVLATFGIFAAMRTQSGLLGGAIVGAAIGTMHYTGMAALRGPIEVSWDAGYVSASLVVGPMFSALAFWTALRGRTVKQKALAAGLLTLGICALHFTAMTAVTLTPIAAATASSGSIAPMSLAVAVAAIAFLIIGLGLTGTLVDQHLGERAQAEATRLRVHIKELEATKLRLEETSSNLSAALAAAALSSQAKSQFLAAMSHELRTPLNAVIGFSALMKMEAYGPLGDHRYAEYSGDIHASGSHLLSLINDVLDLTRLDANRVELEEDVVDLCELVDETLRLVALQAGDAQLTLERHMPEALPQVRIDRRRIKQVLLNLLSNAIKFTPAGGSVSVTAALTRNGLAVAVADTGIGMQAEDIQTALTRFGQIDSGLARKYDGTGLGLPIAEQLVDLHGGAFTIQSVPGAGTTVTVTLPSERVVRTMFDIGAAAS